MTREFDSPSIPQSAAWPIPLDRATRVGMDDATVRPYVLGLVLRDSGFDSTTRLITRVEWHTHRDAHKRLWELVTDYETRETDVLGSWVSESLALLPLCDARDFPRLNTVAANPYPTIDVTPRSDKDELLTSRL